MADYQIGVNVDVDDSQLDEAERKIKALNDRPVNVQIKTEFINGKDLTKNLKKDIQGAIKEAQKSAKSKGNTLSKGFLGTEELDKFAKNLKALTKNIGKELDLGNVKLTINDSIMSELDTLQAKLSSIKNTAKSIGSIKLSVSDNVDLTNGELTVGSDPQSVKALKQKSAFLKEQMDIVKRTAQAEASLSRDLNGKDVEKKNAANEQLIGIRKQRAEALKEISNYDLSEKVIAESSISKILAKAEQESKQINTVTDKKIKNIQDNAEKFRNWYNNSDRLFGQSLGEGYSNRLKEYEEASNKIQELTESLKTADGNQRASINAEIETNINRAREQEKFLKNYDQFLFKSTGKYNQLKYLDKDFNLENLQDNMEGMVKSIANGKKYTTEFNAETKKMVATIEQGGGLVEKYSVKYKEGPNTIESSLSHVSQQIKPLSSYFSDLGEKFKTLSQYLVSNFGFQALQTGVTSGITAIRELDSAMTELKKTSEGTKQQYREFTKQANKDAKDVGSTTTQITNSAASWSRFGHSLQDSSTMAKQTSILKNVSEFETIDEATDSLVGIMEAYHIEPKDASELIDKLNKIGNNFSISTSGLAQALQISGSMLEVAGNTKEESMAIVTAMNSSIQDPSQAARAARTVAMRLTGVDSETLQSEGEDVEGLIESVPKLEEKIKSLTAVNGKLGVSLTDSVGNFRSTYEILSDIADRWKEIQEADKKDGLNRANDLLETMAGKNRANALASLLSNPAMLKNVYEQSTTDFLGSAQNELNTYLDSVEAKITRIQESWAQIWQSEGATNSMKGFLDVANGAISLIDTIGPMNTLFGIGGAAIGRFANWDRINYQLVL